MVEYNKYVEDLGFEVVEKFFSGVFKVSRSGLLAVIKLGMENTFSGNQATTENRALDIVRGIDGIVEKLGFHEFEVGSCKLSILVKKYVEGRELCYHKGAFDKDVLVNAVNALHEKGVASLDLHKHNIIIDSSLKPWLIDFGICTFKEDQGEHFEYDRQYDLGNLDRILREY